MRLILLFLLAMKTCACQEMFVFEEILKSPDFVRMVEMSGSRKFLMGEDQAYIDKVYDIFETFEGLLETRKYVIDDARVVRDAGNSKSDPLESYWLMELFLAVSDKVISTASRKEVVTLLYHRIEYHSWLRLIADSSLRINARWEPPIPPSFQRPLEN